MATADPKLQARRTSPDPAYQPAQRLRRGLAGLALFVCAVAGVLVAPLSLPAPPTQGSAGWSAPQNIDGTQYINSVSCPSTTFCVAVDNGGKALYYNSGTWTGPTAIAGASATIYEVSCVSTTFCMAVDAAGHALQYSGGTSWAVTTQDAGIALKAVSCHSTAFCMAVDAAGKAFLYTGSWIGLGNIDGGRAFYSISCPSETTCEAVDGSGYQVAYNNGWGVPSQIDATGGGFNSVSCLLTTSCIAGDANGNVLTLTGTTWSGQTLIDSGKQIEWATCPSATFCLAVDSAGRYLSWNGTTWSGATTIDGTNAFVVVSCPDTSFCMAVDAVGNAVKYTGAPLASTGTTVTSSANPSSTGQSVTYTATVTPGLVQRTTVPSSSSVQTLNFGTATAAGDLLVATLGSNSGNVTWTASPGWTQVVSATLGSATSAIWYYPNNPGGITAATFTSSGSSFIGQLTEWSGTLVAPLDMTGGNTTGSPGLTFPVSTSGADSAAGDIGITAFSQDTGTNKTTAGVGWAHMGTGSDPGWASDSQTNLPAAVASETETSSVGGSGWAATIATFKTSSAPPTPTGTITFQDAGINIAGCVAVSVNGSAQATCSSPVYGSAGSHSITANYSGDGNYSASASPSMTQTVSASPPPTVTMVNPATGPTTGGVPVMISGTNFTGATAVSFGGTAAASFTVQSATLISAVSPVEAAATVDITVTTPGGTSSASAADKFVAFAPGTVSAWGSNPVGELGDGTLVDKHTAVPVSTLSGVVTLASGRDHGLALKSDGTVWAWGNNNHGQLGDNTITNRPTPVQVSGLAGVVAIGGGGDHSVAVKSDGTVWAWGENANGQLGDNTTTERHLPVQVSTIGGAVAVSSGSNFSMALKSDGTVWAWGMNTNGELGDNTTVDKHTPVQASGLSGGVAISGGNNHSLALKSDGTVWAWGQNANGQLGDTTTVDKHVPVQVIGLSGATAITANSSQSLAAKSDGTAWAWGANASGQLGDNTTVDKSSPVQVSGLTGVVSLNGGTAHSLALKSDGTVWAWGSNSNGQLGDNTTVDKHTPVQAIGVTGAVGVGGRGTHSYAMSSTTAPGVTLVNPATGPTTGGTPVIITGTNFTGATAVKFGGTAAASFTVQSATRITVTSPVEAAATVDITVTTPSGTSAASAADHFAVSAPGSLYAWGQNSSGEVGDNTTTDRYSPVLVSGLNSVVNTSAGNAHTLALKSDGTVWSWGDNTHGQLGDGTTTQRNAAVQVSGLSSVVSIAAGSDHSLALKSDGTVWAWGNNANGELGDNTTSDRLVPVQVSGLSGVVGIAAGFYHSLAVRVDGTVWAWGDNNFGQLGDNTTTDRWTPVQVAFLSQVTGLAAGGEHSLALRADGTVWAWGDNQFGQLGDNTTTERNTPTPTTGLSGVVAVAGGGWYHSLALKSDGTVWAWGYNATGEVGDNTVVDRHVPTQTSGVGSAIALAAGQYYSAALKADGTTWTWGYNSNGQLGDTTTVEKHTPVQTALTGPAAGIGAGGAHTLALKVAAASTTTLTSSTNPSVVGQPVTYTASVTPTTPMPTGTVTFQDNGTNIGGCVGVAVNGSGQATCTPATYTSVAGSPHPITAIYSGDGNYSGSASAVLNQVVNQAATTTAGGSSADPSKSGQSVTFTATVVAVAPGAGTPGGAVTFMDGATSLGTAPLAAGSATLATAGLGTGDHAITVTYNGDSNFTTSGSPLLVQVVVISAGTTGVSWGKDNVGQLGNGTVTASPNGVPANITSINNLVQVAQGGDNSVGLRADGTVWAWGDNTNGALGQGTTDGAAHPNAVQVKGPGGVGFLNNMVQVAASNGMSLALRNDGTVWTWGQALSGNSGQGIGFPNGAVVYPGEVCAPGQASPCASFLTGVVKIAGGGDLVALRSDGTVWTWGWNNNFLGGLGDGQTGGEADAPVQVCAPGQTAPCSSFLSNITDISAGPVSYGGLGLRSDGTVWGWGNNTYGQDGDGTTTNRVAPVEVCAPGQTAPCASFLTGIVGLGSGTFSSFAIKSDGSAWAWGDNQSGQLGINSMTVSGCFCIMVPTQVRDAPGTGFLSGVTSVAGGKDDSTLIAGGVVYTVGSTPEANPGSQTPLAVGNVVPATGTGSISADSTTSLLGVFTPYTPTVATPTSSVDPSVYGQSITFTVTVSGPAIYGTPTGTAAFYDGATLLGSGVLNAAGTGSFTTAGPLGVGPHSITVQYSGDSTYATGTSAALTQTVNQSATTISVSGAPNPSSVGQSVTFTATISVTAPGSGSTTGTVTFYDGATPLGSVAVAANSASYSTAALTQATHNITAVYSGDGNFTTSTSPVLSQVVSAVGTPMVTSVVPGSGAPGDLITINGSNFGTTFSDYGWPTAFGNGPCPCAGYISFHDNGVNWGESGNQANFQIVSWTPTQIVFLVPLPNRASSTDYFVQPLTTANFTVTNDTAAGRLTSASQNLSIVASSAGTPTVTSVVPAQGPLSGGGAVTVNGTNFNTVTAVNFGGNTAAVWTVTAAGQMTVTVPAGSAGTVDVIITAVSGVSSAVAADHYTYVPAPTVTMVNPAAGPTTGGTPVIITGTNFSGATAVTFGGTAAASFTVQNATSITATSPVEAGGTVDITVTTPGGASATSPADHFAVFSPGNAAAWGDNFNGQLGDNTTVDKHSPMQVGGLSNVTAIAGGSSHTVALKSDGTVWAWGSNPYGELGDNTTVEKHTPVQVSGLSGVTSIAVGVDHSLALKSDGTVWAWGLNSNGQLGDNTTVDKHTAVQVSGLSGVTAIAAGDLHSLALKSDGTVWAWGLNGTGQLGDNTTLDRHTPVQVSGLSGVTAIAGGVDYSLALKSDGTVWAWGFNFSGQLGDNTTIDRHTAVQVAGVSGVTAIAGGGAHGLALKSDGTVWAWGYNLYGQLGDNTTVDKHTAVQVSGLSGITAIAGGQSHSLALKSDATVWDWGYNFWGELGDNTTADKHVPVQVAGLVGVVGIGGGYKHTLAIGTVTIQPSTTTITSSANPSVVGQPVTYTASVTPTAPMPTGMMTFQDNGTNIAGCVNVAVNGTGQATCTPATYGSVAGSPHPITATYSGDGNYFGSTSAALSQTVNQDATTTVVTSSVNPSVSGQSTTFTATVTASGPGGGTPTNTVTFQDAGSNIAGCTNVVLNGSGQATCPQIYLAGGSPQAITAIYAGDANFVGSTSAVMNQVINKDSTTTVVTSSANPSVTGQSVTLTATVTANAPGAFFTGGTVTFQDGGADIPGCVGLTLVGGSITCGQTYASPAAHTITAIYAGDSNFTGSTSLGMVQNVNQAATITTVSSGTNPSVFGQSVTFTANVSVTAPGTGTATGTVTFKDGGTTLGTGTLSGGLATFSTTSLGVGGHPTITAVYAGDTNFTGSTSANFTQTVNKDATTTAVTSSGSPSVSGQPVIYTATVTASAPGAGTPSATVTFQDGGANIATCVGVALNVSAQATCSLTYAGPLGSPHSITAIYSGDTSFLGSTSGAISQTVNKDTTATGLVNPVNPSTTGQAVTFTATVSASAPGSGTPSGTVTFQDGGSNIATCVGVALSGGVATCGQTYAAIGSHNITAIYSGDGNYITSTSAVLTQSVVAGSSTTAVASSTNPSVFGQSVTFTATVTGASPTGTVTFKDGATVLGSGAVNGSFQATYATTSLPIGARSITAIYGGDVNNGGSTSPVLTQTVNQDATTTAVTSSANPSVSGQTVTYTATVTAGAPGSGTPTGTVDIKDGAVTVCAAVALSGGVATCNHTYAGTAGSPHSMTAVYSGDGNFTTSTSAALSQMVGKAATSTTVVSSANPSVSGQSVTYTATVSAVAPGAGTPTATVDFKDGAAIVCAAAPLNGAGQATCVQTYAGTAGSPHSMTVVYSGDANFSTSTSAALSQTVNQSATTTTVASSANPSVNGQNVTFTVTVNANAPGSGTPTGTVDVKLNGITVCLPMALNGSGQASCSMFMAGTGSYTMTSAYSGDANYAGSTSAGLTQTVNQASTTTSVVSSSNPSVSGQSVTFTATVATTAPGTGTATGTVTFKDGGIVLGTGGLNVSGQATFTTNALAVGAHPTITAVYAGDTNFTGSTSAALSQTVNQASSTTAVTSSVNPSALGQAVTFTAAVSAVAPGSGTATGTITFQDSGSNIATCVNVAMVGGSATCSQTYSSVAAHPITANYSGDGNFTLSTSAVLTQNVSVGSATVATPASSLNPSSYGSNVTFSVTVTGSGVTPTGTVAVKDGATTICAAVPLVAGTATCSTATLLAGAHSITGTYSGDGNYAAGAVSAGLTQTVNPAASATSVVSSVNPSSYTQNVTFTATVAGPGLTPTGTVTFYDGGTAISAPVALAAGSASYSTATLLGGAHSITAQYSGDANHNASTSAALTQTVNTAASATSVVSSVNPSNYAQSVTFSATVSGAGITPTGTVTFKDGATTLGSAALAGGVATYTTSTLGGGVHSITVQYSGDANYATSTSAALTQTVNAVAPTVATPTSSLNPSAFSQGVTFSTTVSGSGATPSGTVTFFDGATPLATVALSGTGTAAYATAALTVGGHSITVTYNSDGNYTAGTSAALTQTVTVAASNIAPLTSTVNPSQLGQATTITATVSGSSGTPTGTVTFRDGATVLATSPLNGAGAGSLNTATLGLGNHSITASYGGDATYSASNSGALTQTVVKASSSVSSVTVTPPNSTYGQGITVTATVTGGGPPPTGTVTFYDNGVPIGSGSINGAGQASFTTTTPTSGNNTWTAGYAGDGNHTGSTSPTGTSATTTPANTTVTVTATQGGTAVTVTGTVGSNTGATPIGVVTIYDNGVPVGTVTLNGSGQGTWTTTTSSLPPGQNNFSASYNPANGNFNSASSGGSVTITVTQAPPGTAAPTASASPSASPSTSDSPSPSPSATSSAPASASASPSAGATINGNGGGSGDNNASGQGFFGAILGVPAHIVAMGPVAISISVLVMLGLLGFLAIWLISRRRSQQPQPEASVRF